MRIRLTFSKTGALRYTGHLDLQRIWERTARRAGLPLVYSQGFHPQPKIQIAAALPLGFSGRAELVDIWLQDDVGAGLAPPAQLAPAQNDHKDHPDDEITRKLQTAAPPGLTILSIENVDERGPALQTQVIAAEYEVTLLEAVDEAALTHNLSAVLEAESLPRVRRGKAYDLRPLIELLHLFPCPLVPPPPRPPVGHSLSPAPLLLMRLTAREGATGRP
ncbi:MAG: TIGR03936 family radical SAM-associated protein, partial [Anaerolineales bacterium]|nr:TIGR03936 family radical SAM-associated protein [Anaerolineales bacterium]